LPSAGGSSAAKLAQKIPIKRVCSACKMIVDGRLKCSLLRTGMPEGALEGAQGDLRWLQVILENYSNWNGPRHDDLTFTLELHCARFK